MRNLHGRGPAQPTGICHVAAILATWLLGACTPTHLVVTDAPPLAGIRTVYMRPFASGDEGPHAAAAMTHALKAQLQEDGFFQVVEDPTGADAYCRGTVGKWARGGLDWQGARSTVISGTLTLLTAADQRLWFAAAVQQVPGAWSPMDSSPATPAPWPLIGSKRSWRHCRAMGCESALGAG